MSTLVPGPNNAPLPAETPMVVGIDYDILRRIVRNPESQEKDYSAYLITAPWADYLGQLTAGFSLAPQRVASDSLSSQSASIGLTALPTAGSTAVYRVTWEAWIETPDGVSSSLTTTVTFTQGGVTKSYSGAAMTGDTTATWQSDTKMFAIDANTPVSYSTTYASNTPALMQYGLIVTLELVQL